MDTIYDLKNKLSRKKTIRSHNRNFYLHSKSLSDKRQDLMKVIIATAQDQTEFSRPNNLIINDLVRIKRFNRKTNVTNHKKSSYLIKKRKQKSNSFRVQKTYRFRNYRLRCIRLRQSQVKEQRRQRRYSSLRQNLNKTTRELTKLMSSSCAETTSDSNMNAPSQKTNKKALSSSSSGGEEALSLVECFRQTKFLNSSDTRDEEDDLKKFDKFKTKSDSIVRRGSKKFKYSFKKKLNRLGYKSIMIKENRYFNVKRAQLFCDCRYCNFKPSKKVNDSIKQQQQQFNFKKIYLKRKRTALKDESQTNDQIKKLKFESAMCQSQDYSLSSLKSSNSSGGEDTNNYSKEDDSSIKSDDTTNESNNSCKNFNLKQCFKSSKSFSELTVSSEANNVKNGEHLSSNDEEENDNLDDADDEQSDWTANENSHKLYSKQTNKSSTQLSNSSNASSNRQIDYLSDAFKVIPWWNNEIVLENKKNSKQNISNYEKLNRFGNSHSDNSEFDQILSGALGLMCSSSKRKFKERLKSRVGKSNSASLTRNCIATKSSTNLDSLLENSSANKPINEDNKGNRMLQQMGWIPGTSLGVKHNENNLINPIMAIKRPNRVGLGFGEAPHL